MTKQKSIINRQLRIEKSRKTNIYRRKFSMSFVTGDNRQVCSSVGCRDYVHDAVRTLVNDNKRNPTGDCHEYFPELGDPDMCMDRLRLLLKFDNIKENKLEFGLKVLNTIEDYADVERTIGELVICDNDPKIQALLLRGSPYYMHNPHLLSLITLVMRFCTLNPKFKYNKVEDLTVGYTTLLNDSKIAYDSHLMSHCHKWLHIILKERKEIFKGLTIKELYPIEYGDSFHSAGGIYSLCNGNSPNKCVNDRIKKLKEKYK